VDKHDVIRFGKGGVDDAEDAEVILHEYGHAIQDSQQPAALRHSEEAGAIGEGFGDYWAATVSNVFAPTPDPACIADWDSVSYTRRVPHCLRPRWTRICTTRPTSTARCTTTGQIWSRALWDIRGALGHVKADTIILEAQFALRAGHVHAGRGPGDGRCGSGSTATRRRTPSATPTRPAGSSRRVATRGGPAAGPLLSRRDRLGDDAEHRVDRGRAAACAVHREYAALERAEGHGPRLDDRVERLERELGREGDSDPAATRPCQTPWSSLSNPMCGSNPRRGRRGETNSWQEERAVDVIHDSSASSSQAHRAPSRRAMALGRTTRIGSSMRWVCSTVIVREGHEVVLVHEREIELAGLHPCEARERVVLGQRELDLRVAPAELADRLRHDRRVGGRERGEPKHPPRNPAMAWISASAAARLATIPSVCATRARPASVSRTDRGRARRARPRPRARAWRSAERPRRDVKASACAAAAIEPCSATALSTRMRRTSSISRILVNHKKIQWL
jgi:hypothetical protein